MLSYYVIYHEKFRKVMQRTEKEGFKRGLIWPCPSLAQPVAFDKLITDIES